MFNLFKQKTKKKKVYRGLFYSWNSWKALGHKGRVVKVKKDKAKVVLVTHHSKTLGQDNIQLNQNPNKNDSRKSYALRYPQEISISKVGKVHPDMKVRNSHDKSIFRKIGKKKKLFPVKKEKVFNKKQHKKK